MRVSEGLVTFSSGRSSTCCTLFRCSALLVSSEKTSTRSCIDVQFQEYGWQLERKQVEACGNDSEQKELEENSS